MPNNPKLPRGVSYCFGWNCLTSAQQFGVIFSVVVVSVFLAIVWMCYLGKATILKKQRSSVRLPGGRRIPRAPTNHPEIVALDQLPNPPTHAIPQQGHSGSTFIQFPQAQPYMIAQQHFPRPPTPMPFLPGPVPNAGYAYEGPPPEATPIRSQSFAHEPGRRSWRQRLGAMLKMPMGRASTISSAESIRTHHQGSLAVSSDRVTRSGSAHHKKPYPGSNSFDHQSRHQQPTVPSIRLVEQETTLRGHGNGDDKTPTAHSLHSDIATVRSDDYYTENDGPSTEMRVQKAKEISGKLPFSQPVLSPQGIRVRNDLITDDNDMASVPSISSVSLGFASSGRSGSGSLSISNHVGKQGLRNDEISRGTPEITPREKLPLKLRSREQARARWDRRFVNIIVAAKSCDHKNAQIALNKRDSSSDSYESAEGPTPPRPLNQGRQG